MTQRDLHRAIARATGESVRMIERLGFSLLHAESPQSEADALENRPQIIDWDQLEQDRIGLAIQA